jgi:hypothetical protein
MVTMTILILTGRKHGGLNIVWRDKSAIFYFRIKLIVNIEIIFILFFLIIIFMFESNIYLNIKAANCYVNHSLPSNIDV